MNGRMMQQFNEKTEWARSILVIFLGPEKALELMRKRREESDRREHERKMLHAISMQPTPIVQPSFPWFWIVIICTLYAAMCGIYLCR